MNDEIEQAFRQGYIEGHKDNAYAMMNRQIAKHNNETDTLDVQPITYCKDCKNYNGKRHKCQITYNYHGQKFFRGEYDYCSKGEKWGNNG